MLSPPKNKRVCATEATHTEKHIAPFATTQHFQPIPKYAKIKPAFLPKDKIHTCSKRSIKFCVVI